MREHKLALYHFGVAVIAFAIGTATALMQALSRADLPLPLRSAEIYYISVTAHGVLLAIVFTTFFIMGLGYFLSREALGRNEARAFAWAAFWIGVTGTLITVAAILSGSSTVLYTFYPPLQAHPLFYIGATLVVVGSWGWCWVMFSSYRSWRAEFRQRPVPLSIYGMMATVVIWILATAGLAIEVVGMLIPWSLGWVERIDPVVARTFFWWFGHPLVYFWLLPAYVLWYAVLPKVAGGRLFSDPLGRMVFVLFILLSTPVGFHHQFMDPGISAGWKLLHTVNTYAILYPSFVTAFTIVASLEVAGRIKGATGLFNWVRKLPWGDPFFSSVALAMLAFTVGGFGGAITSHITGLLGMPRRIFTFSYQGAEVARQWAEWTSISAVGGVILYTSAACYLMVVVGTLIWGRRIDRPEVEFSEPIEAVEHRRIWDRLGLWTAVAVILIVIAYFYPIYDLLMLERFGSPGFKPF